MSEKMKAITIFVDPKVLKEARKVLIDRDESVSAYLRKHLESLTQENETS